MKSLEEELVTEIFQYCTAHNTKIRTAESCTGGSLASRFTTLPGSSQFFDRGVVTYSNQAKQEVLNIPSSILNDYGAVSFETATLMAENLTNDQQNIISIATTGILGPDTDNTNRPVGLVYIAIHHNHQTEVQEFNLSGNRNSIKEQVIIEALKLCLSTIRAYKALS